MGSYDFCDIHPISIENFHSLSSPLSFPSSYHDITVNSSDYLSLKLSESVFSLLSSTPFLSSIFQNSADVERYISERSITKLQLTFIRLILCFRSEIISSFFLIIFLLNLFRFGLFDVINHFWKKFIKNNKNEKSSKFVSDNESVDNNYIVKHTSIYKLKNAVLIVVICAHLCELFISGYYFYSSLTVCRKVSFNNFFDKFLYALGFQTFRIVALICILHYTSVASSIKSRCFPSLSTLKHFLKQKVHKNRFMIALFWTLSLLNSFLNISLSFIDLSLRSPTFSPKSSSSREISIFQLCNLCRWQTLLFADRAVYFDSYTNDLSLAFDNSTLNTPLQSSQSISPCQIDSADYFDANRHTYNIFFHVIYALLYSALFFLSFFPEFDLISLVDKRECSNPENNASMLSCLTYGWFSAKIYQGFLKPLELSDIYTINIWLKAESIWTSYSEIQSKFYGSHFLSLLLKRFGLRFMKISILQLIPIALQLLQPFWIVKVIDFVKDSDASIWRGIVYLCAMMFCTIIFSITNNYFDYRMLNLCLEIRACITAEIYNRLLLCQQWSETRQRFSSAQLINFVSIDTFRLYEFLRQVNLFWTSPIRIVVSVYLLWSLLGSASIGCLAVLILLLPVNTFIGSKLKALQAKFLQFKDNRLKRLNEALGAIKAIKLYAWECVFIKKISYWREKETSNLRAQMYYSSVITFAFNSITFLISFVTFGLFVIFNPNEQLDAKKIFVSFSIFDIIRRPFGAFPQLITTTMMFLVSTKRIMEFFRQTDNTLAISSFSSTSSFHSNSSFSSSSVVSSSSSSPSSSRYSTVSYPSTSQTLAISEPYNESSFGHQEQIPQNNSNYKEPFIELRNCTFGWNSSFQLKSLNLTCEKSKLVAIVGEIGSGKTSLLMSLLDQIPMINRHSDTVFKVKGTIAYVSQNSWLHAGTIRDNILFGRPFNSEFYQRVWTGCALHQDNFLNGDLTVIDSEASSLSGGQRQRVTLARAVYSGADIYLLDDPLSALDSTVSKHVFTHLLGRHGLLKDKIRLLVTHNMTFMSQVDDIIFLQKGVIATQGHYRDLVEKLGDNDNPFSEFLAGVFSAPATMEDDPPEIIVEPEDLEMMKEISFKLEPHLNRMNSVKKRISCRSSIKSSEPHLISYSPLDSLKLTRKQNRYLKEFHQGNENSILKKNNSGGEISSYIQSLGYWPIAGIILFYCFGHLMFVASQIWLSIYSQENKDLSSLKKNSTVFPSQKMPSEILEEKKNSGFCVEIYGLFGLGQTLSIIIATVWLCLRGVYSANDIHNRLLARVMSAPLWFFDNLMFGEIVNHFTKDIEIAEFNLINSLRSFCIQTFRTICAFILIIYGTNNIWISLFFVPVFLLYYAIYRYYIKTSRQIVRLEAKIRGEVYDNLREAHSGLAIIKSFGAEERFMKKNFESVDRQTSALHMNIVAKTWLTFRLELLSNFVVLVTVAFCIMMRDQISEGMAGLCVNSALSLTTTFNVLIRSSSDLENNVVTVERLFQFMKIPQEFVSLPFNFKKKFSLFENFQNINTFESASLSKNWLQNGNICINNFSASYKPEQSYVLKNISINIKHGWKVVIVGRTGSGKSSLALSLFRLVEFGTGRILISNRDISQLDLYQLRSYLTIIPQDPLLFSGTLRENLDPANLYSDEQIHSALKMVRFEHDWALLDRTMDETTLRSISAGQKQLLCLARALLRKPKVLILDEATAAIDHSSEEFVQEVIQREFSDCTVLTIAHRLNTVMRYPVDRILVLDQSRVAEFDTPEVLLNRPGSIFSNLIKKA